MGKRLVSAGWLTSAGIAVVLATAAAAATGASAKASGVAQTPLRFRVASEPVTLDWNFADSSAETYIVLSLMEGLVEEGPDLEPRPSLASRWEVSPDGLKYTFVLRDGVKWSDGKKLRAQDFVDSWIRLIHPKSHTPYSSFLDDVVGAQEFAAGKTTDASKVGVKALDDSRLEVRLRRRVPYFLHLPTFWVLYPIRADLIRKNGADWAKPGKIATLGPYRLKAWTKGKAISLERNPAYSGAAPAIESVVMEIEPDQKKARDAFGAGKLDFLLEAMTEDLMKAREPAAGQRVVQFDYLATFYLGFSTKKEPLSRPDLRRAIAGAIERVAIPAAMQGGQQVATSFVPPGLGGYTPPAPLVLSAFEQRGLLERSGFPEGRGIPRLSLWVRRVPGAEELGALIARSLQTKLGIGVDVHVCDYKELQTAISEKKADLFVRHWGADFPDAFNFLSVFQSGNGNNHTGWANVAYDQWMEKAREAGDAKSRLDAYAQAEALLLNDQAVIVPLFRRKNAVVLGPRVERFSLSPLNYLFLKDLSLK
jgi:oligopeptide transport system substrate-binding protein